MGQEIDPQEKHNNEMKAFQEKLDTEAKGGLYEKQFIHNDPFAALGLRGAGCFHTKQLPSLDEYDESRD